MTTDKITVPNPISASIVERIAAYFLGIFLMITPIVIVSVIVSVTAGEQGDSPAGLGISILIVAGLLLAFNLYLLINRAQTLGMYVLNLQVVDAATGKPLHAAKHFFLRGLVGQIILRLVPLYGLVDVLFIFGQKRQTLHDLIARSIVVRLDDAIKTKLQANGMASSARHIEYQVAGIQNSPPTRSSVGIMITFLVLFVVIPLLAAVMLVVMNPAAS